MTNCYIIVLSFLPSKPYFAYYLFAIISIPSGPGKGSQLKTLSVNCTVIMFFRVLILIGAVLNVPH